MKKYFLYELKKSFYVIACLIVIATVVYLAPITTTEYATDFQYAVATFETYLWLISWIGGLLAVLVPAWLLSYKMKKRHLDLYYALPLSHSGILLVRFLIGLIAVFAPYTVAYWMGALVLMARVGESIVAVYYLPQFFASLLPVYFLYALSSFFFTRANKSIDGFVFVLFWTFALGLVMLVFSSLICWQEPVENAFGEIWYRTVSAIRPYYYLPFAPLDFTTSYFQERLVGYQVTTSPDTINLVNLVFGFTITTLLAAGATIELFRSERKVKAENAGQISDSPFGYKVMIPLFTVCLLSICTPWFLWVILIAVASFLLTSLYKRTMKIGLKQALVTCASLIVGYALSYIIAAI